MTALRSAVALALALALGACRSPEPRGASAPPAPVRPTLEEIFLEPPLYGESPSVRSLSADGRFALVRWRPLQVDPSGARSFGGDGGARLLDLDVDRARTDAGTRLASALPASASDAEVRATAWAPAGHTLALARDDGIALFDPLEGSLREVATWPAGESDAEGGDSAAETEDGEGAEGPEDERSEENEDGAAGEPAEARPGRIRSIAFDADGATLAISDGDELYLLPLDGDEARAWSELENATEAIDAPARDLSWSNDRRVALSTGAPVVRAEAGASDAADSDAADGDGGGDEARAEEADDGPAHPAPQVYRADLGRAVTLAELEADETIEALRISPDGRFVSGTHQDLADAPEPTLVPDYLTERVTTRAGRRKLADDGPSPTSLFVWSTEDGARREIASNADELAWMRVVGWAPQPEPSSPARFAWTRTSADHRERQLWIWEEGASRLLLTEQHGKWIGGPAAWPRWSTDGRRILLASECLAGSTTPDRAQLFVLELSSGALAQLTEFDGEVASFRALENGGALVVESRPTPSRRRLGVLGPARVRGESAAPEIAWWPLPEGWIDSPEPSAAGDRVVVAHATLGRPAELWIAHAGGAERLTRTAPAAFDSIEWVLPEHLVVRADDGSSVHAHVFLPDGLRIEGGRDARATVVFVHGAGYLQNVRDSLTAYPLNFLFHSRLARLGYVVVDVDYRGSRGYGSAFRTDVQDHLGGLDLEDIHDVVDVLVARGIVDGERVGLYGGSYGGFLTLMALFTAPERWAVGAALRSVTDWRTYHPGYTQPRLGRPSTHPEAYAMSSPIDHVDGLEGPLLVLHGLVDSNVFAQDSIRLIEALIDGGHEFDAMLYPSQGHAFRDGPHWLDEYRRIERYLIEHLGAP